MAHKDLTVEQLKFKREKLREDLLIGLSARISDFQKETGTKITKIDILMVDVSTMDERKSIVSNILIQHDL